MKLTYSLKQYLAPSKHSIMLAIILCSTEIMLNKPDAAAFSTVSTTVWEVETLS